MDQKLRIAFAETVYMLKHLTKEELAKIPPRLKDFMVKNYDQEHNVDIENLTQRTYALLAVIYRKYLAENKEELELEFQEQLKKENETND